MRPGGTDSSARWGPTDCWIAAARAGRTAEPRAREGETNITGAEFENCIFYPYVHHRPGRCVAQRQCLQQVARGAIAATANGGSNGTFLNQTHKNAHLPESPAAELGDAWSSSRCPALLDERPKDDRPPADADADAVADCRRIACKPAKEELMLLPDISTTPTRKIGWRTTRSDQMPWCVWFSSKR